MVLNLEDQNSSMEGRGITRKQLTNILECQQTQEQYTGKDHEEVETWKARIGNIEKKVLKNTKYIIFCCWVD